MSVEDSTFGVERSAPKGAVFLSYASQDAEAARRIAETLREAGVEVWFDQSELVGGDAWDQKIRRQINACALFVPIISQNTQARTEGYFRLEWRLAEQRTFLMAKGRPFLVPIVIDGTRDAEAHVPDSFLEVQWSRFPDGNCDAKFAVLVQRMLSWDGSAAPHAPSPRSTPTTAPTRGKRRPALMLGAITAIVIGAGVATWVATRPAAEKVAPEKSSPADALVAQVWDLLLKPEMARAELDAAELLCERATQLDPTDAAAWAAWATVDTWYYYYSFDPSAERRQQAYEYASRARQLAPDSFEARLAEATLMTRMSFIGSVNKLPNFTEAISLLRPLVTERPTEPRAKFQLGFALLWQSATEEEGRGMLEQVAMNPTFAAKAWNEIAWHYYWRQRPKDAEAAVDRSIAAAAYWDNLCLKAKLQLKWRGDLAGARATIDRMKSAARREEVGATTICEVLRWCRQPAELTDFLASYPREWLFSNEYYGPTSFLAGQARLEAGQRQIANQSFAVTLRQLEPALVKDPNNVDLHYLKAAALHYLGDAEAARQAYQLAKELVPEPPLWIQALMEPTHVVIDRVSAELDRTSPTSGINEVETNTTAASLRLSPIFDPLRGEPRFADLIARAEADPRRSPKANAVPETTGASSVDQKSVAVLAFANLSDDKDNEYFSDGISEELLNVLAKVPGLKVTARTSAFFFKGKQVPIADIAQQLGVAYVVEGSVRKAGDRVRISAQLIKASDGFNVWSDSFNREIKDIFAVQDEIAGRIARELSSRLGVATNAISGTGGTKSVEAYEAFLKGREAWNQRTYSSNQETVRYFQQAIAFDPSYALAHGALAEAYVMLSVTGIEPADKVFPLAKASAERALELDPNIVQAYTALAEYYFHYALDYAESDRQIDRAIAVDPNYAAALSRLSGHLICRNRLEEALALDERCIALNPLGPDAGDSWTLLLMKRYDEALEAAHRESAPDRYPMGGRETVGLVQCLTGHREEGVRTLESVVRDFPEEVEPLTFLGWVYGQAGQTAKARETLQRMMAMGESRYVSALELAKVVAGMNDREQTFAQLERAFARREGELPTIGSSLFFEPIRDDPRFLEMLKRLKLDVYFPEAKKA